MNVFQMQFIKYVKNILTAGIHAWPDKTIGGLSNCLTKII